jgi:hypothetical protein
MTRVFSLSAAFAFLTILTNGDAGAQSAPPAPAQQPAPAVPAQAAPPQAAPPQYGPAPQAEPPPGWGAQQPGYAPAWRSQPIEMRYVEGRPIPPGYHLETRVRRGLVVSGPIIFGVPYLLSMSVAASSKYEPDRWLYAPVFGPFVNLATREDDCNPNTTSGTSTTVICNGESGTRFFLMLDGLMQTAGATLLVLGLALPQHVLVRDDAPFTGSNNKSHFTWAVSPYSVGKAGAGLGVIGTF